MARISRDGLEKVLRTGQIRAITPTRHTFCQIQAYQIASRNAIKHAPDLSFGIRVQISGCGSTPRTTIEIEAKPIALDAAGTAL